MEPDYSGFSIEDLKRMCRERRLQTTREELVAKLKVAYAKSSQAAGSTGKREADSRVERVDVSSLMRAAKTGHRVFGVPNGGGPESALGDSYSFAGHPSAQRFAVGERVLLGTDECVVQKAGRDGDGAWVYDLRREQDRQVEHKLLQNRDGGEGKAFTVGGKALYLKVGKRLFLVFASHLCRTDSRTWSRLCELRNRSVLQSTTSRF
jgi:hypothetical protein